MLLIGQQVLESYCSNNSPTISKKIILYIRCRMYALLFNKLIHNCMVFSHHNHRIRLEVSFVARPAKDAGEGDQSWCARRIPAMLHTTSVRAAATSQAAPSTWWASDSNFSPLRFFVIVFTSRKWSPGGRKQICHSSYFFIGKHHSPITTSNVIVNTWTNQLLYTRNTIVSVSIVMLYIYLMLKTEVVLEAINVIVIPKHLL